jgi:hypothetical protein
LAINNQPTENRENLKKLSGISLNMTQIIFFAYFTSHNRSRN